MFNNNSSNLIIDFSCKLNAFFDIQCSSASIYCLRSADIVYMYWIISLANLNFLRENDESY